MQSFFLPVSIKSSQPVPSSVEVISAELTIAPSMVTFKVSGKLERELSCFFQHTLGLVSVGTLTGKPPEYLNGVKSLKNGTAPTTTSNSETSRVLETICRT
jgi:hypothetical protein